MNSTFDLVGQQVAVILQYRAVEHNVYHMLFKAAQPNTYGIALGVILEESETSQSKQAIDQESIVAGDRVHVQAALLTGNYPSPFIYACMLIFTALAVYEGLHSRQRAQVRKVLAAGFMEPGFAYKGVGIKVALSSLLALSLEDGQYILSPIGDALHRILQLN